MLVKSPICKYLIKFLLLSAGLKVMDSESLGEVFMNKARIIINRLLKQAKDDTKRSIDSQFLALNVNQTIITSMDNSFTYLVKKLLRQKLVIQFCFGYFQTTLKFCFISELAETFKDPLATTVSDVFPPSIEMPLAQAVKTEK